VLLNGPERRAAKEDKVWMKRVDYIMKAKVGRDKPGGGSGNESWGFEWAEESRGNDGV